MAIPAGRDPALCGCGAGGRRSRRRWAAGRPLPPERAVRIAVSLRDPSGSLAWRPRPGSACNRTLSFWLLNTSSFRRCIRWPSGFRGDCGSRFLPSPPCLWVSVAQKRTAESLRRAHDDLRATVAELRRSETYLAEAQRLSNTGSFGWKIGPDEIFWSKETYRIMGFDESLRPTSRIRTAAT